MSAEGAGFSMVEILVAIGVLALGLLGVLSAFAYGHRASAQGAKMTEATTMGRQAMEVLRLRNVPFTDPIQDSPDARVPLEAEPLDSDLPGGTGFTRNVFMERLSADSDNYLHNLARIRLTLYWKERGVEKSVTYEAYHRNP